MALNGKHASMLRGQQRVNERYLKRNMSSVQPLHQFLLCSSREPLDGSCLCTALGLVFYMTDILHNAAGFELLSPHSGRN